MKEISKWASQNVLASRVLIVIAFSLMFLCTSLMAILLYDLKIMLPLSFAYLSLAGYLSLLLFYPTLRAQLGWSNHYARRKMINQLGVVTFVIISMVSVNDLMYTPETRQNEISLNDNFSNSNNYASLVVLQANKKAPKNLNQLKSSKFKLKLKPKIATAIKDKLKKLKTNQSKGNRALKLFLMSLLLAGLITVLTFALGFLVCHLSCSGYAVWTGVAIIGGLGVLGFTLAFGIKLINRWAKKNKNEQEISSKVSLI